MIVSIGFTPDAVGNADASVTTSPRRRRRGRRDRSRRRSARVAPMRAVPIWCAENSAIGACFAGARAQLGARTPRARASSRRRRRAPADRRAASRRRVRRRRTRSARRAATPVGQALRVVVRDAVAHVGALVEADAAFAAVARDRDQRRAIARGVHRLRVRVAPLPRQRARHQPGMRRRGLDHRAEPGLPDAWWRRRGLRTSAEAGELVADARSASRRATARRVRRIARRARSPDAGAGACRDAASSRRCARGAPACAASPPRRRRAAHRTRTARACHRR